MVGLGSGFQRPKLVLLAWLWRCIEQRLEAQTYRRETSHVGALPLPWLCTYIVSWGNVPF